jgi:hypothetical protein
VRLARVRISLRGMMVAVAIVAALLMAARFVLGYLGPRGGFYSGSYSYLDSDWRWHEVRGAVIYVKDGMIFVD